MRIAARDLLSPLFRQFAKAVGAMATERRFATISGKSGSTISLFHALVSRMCLFGISLTMIVRAGPWTIGRESRVTTSLPER